MTATAIWVWVAILAALFGCFFAACNYALLDFSRSRLTELFERRGRSGRTEQLMELRDGLLLVTAVLRSGLNLLVLLAMLVLLAPVREPHGWLEVAMALAAAVAMVAVFGVAIPISWSRYAAEPLLVAALPALRAIHVVLRPITLALHMFDPVVRRLLGVPKPSEDDRSPAEQDIRDAVREGEKSGLVDEEQRDMIEAVVEFPSITVEQIMTPRTEIEGIEAGSSLEDVKRFVAQAGHSRVPVYEGDLDHIAGLLYVKDLIPLLGLNGEHHFDLRQIVREAVFVPEAKTLRDLLGQFKAQKVHMAIVLDEYGGTAGLVTIEDIIEEIVGEIRDEYEPVEEEEPAIHAVPVNGEGEVYDVHARVRIDEVNDRLHVELPEDDDYDTIGGFVFATLGRIPEVGESFEREGLRITVTEAEKTRVNRLRIEREGAEAGKSGEESPR